MPKGIYFSLVCLFKGANQNEMMNKIGRFEAVGHMKYVDIKESKRRLFISYFTMCPKALGSFLAATEAQS